MKIICDNCSAKYSIADEKVAGKIFKIRCKKCSAVMEVRGDQVGFPSEEATKIYSGDSDAIWYVVVAGEQQGPITPDAIGKLYADGDITADTYVWCEGFSDWRAAKEVPELAALVGVVGAERMRDPTQEIALPAEDAIPQREHTPRDAHEEADADEDDENDATLEDEPAGDVLAPAAAAAAEPAVDPLVALAPKDPVVSGPQRMTGQRNENSVLFSLSNLQALASQPNESQGAATAAALETAPRADLRLASSNGESFSDEEGSGLIDIRALARSSAATSSAGQPASPDRFALGEELGVGSSLGGPILGAPMAEDSGLPKWFWPVLGAGGVLMLCLVITVGYLALRQPPQVVTSGEPTAEPAPAPAATPAAAAADPEPAAPTPSPAAAEDTPEERAEAEPAKAPSVKSASSSSKPRASRRRAASSAPSPSKSNSDSSIEDLMKNVIDGSGPSKETRASRTRSSSSSSSSSSADSDLPASPSRDDVKRALSSVNSGVRACGSGTSGKAMVNVVFSGSTGRVRSAKVVEGPFQGTSTGTCIARAVRKARVPRFKQNSLTVRFPYQL